MSGTRDPKKTHIGFLLTLLTIISALVIIGFGAGVVVGWVFL